MPCDTKLKPKQTIHDRMREIKAVTARFNSGLASGKIKAVVGPQGAIAFSGVADDEKDGVTDACIYRRLMVEGSALAKAAIQKAELLAGRSVDRKVLAAGVHSHSGGKHWHHGH